MNQSSFPENNQPKIQFDLQPEQESIIKVIGIGGGGSNAVNHMFRQGIKGVEFLVCNTDAQALSVSPVPYKIQLGPELTDGRGAGAIPEVGRKAAEENVEEIRRILSDGTRMVFITAGMGGGTGTGAAPIIAGIARELGILTVGIVTVPFAFEGRKRKQQAEEGIERMKESVDALLVICNDKLREMYGNLNLTRAFGHADDVLTVAAKSIAEIITNTMHMNVDFADIQTVMRNSGVAIMGSAAAEGENRAVRAAEQALNSPLLNDNVIEGARYILLNITSGDMEVTMDEVGEINDYIQAQAGQTADIIMGIGLDSTLGDKVGVTVIATGFKTSDQIQHEEKRPGVIVHRLMDEKPATPEPASSPEPITENNVPPVAESLAEPVLIVRDAPLAETPVVNTMDSEEMASAHQVIEFDFPLDKAEPVIIRTEAENTTPPPVFRNEPEVVKHDLYSNLPSTPAKPEEKNTPQVSPEEEIYLRSKERIMRLKEMSYKMNSPNGISDLEKEPAYKRRNIKIDNTPSSADSNVSRYTLSMDENEKKPEIRPNNPFLHDRVD